MVYGGGILLFLTKMNKYIAKWIASESAIIIKKWGKLVCPINQTAYPSVQHIDNEPGLSVGEVKVVLQITQLIKLSESAIQYISLSLVPLVHLSLKQCLFWRAPFHLVFINMRRAGRGWRIVGQTTWCADPDNWEGSFVRTWSPSGPVSAIGNKVEEITLVYSHVKATARYANETGSMWKHYVPGISNSAPICPTGRELGKLEPPW